MPTEETRFSTRDLALAATLSTLKFEIKSIDYQIEGTRNMPVGYFNFDNTPEIEEKIKEYWQGKLLVEPRFFMTNMQGLKAQVANAYKNPNNTFNR